MNFKSITNEFVKIINLKINDDLKTLFDLKFINFSN